MEKIKSCMKKLWQMALIRTMVYSACLNIVIECLNKRSLTGLVSMFTSPVIFMLNTLIIAASMSLALVFKRRIFAYISISIIWILLSITNFIVLSSRKTPFTAMDIMLIEDAIKVIPIYINILEMILIVAGLCLVIAGLVMLWRKAPKIETDFENKKFYFFGVIRFVFMFLIAYGFAATLIISGYVQTHFGNLAQAYKQYGFAYCFVSSVVDHGISKSKEYSDEYMDDLKQSIDDGTIQVSEKTPNVIFVQLESFFDPKEVTGVTFSENPTPNLDKLMSECSSGYLSVPAFGAGTANTEFEIQTGVNLDDFGPGEYPYKTVMQSRTCESAAYNLKNLGYATHAIHNNDATFYDRYKIFSHLGYDTFTSIEYMSGYTCTPTGWAKDNILTGEIKKALDSTEDMDYVFTISVQGHGDYPEQMVEGYTPKIKVSDFFNPEEQNQFEYYVNQIHEMDAFIGELVDMLANRDEETVLVMYGDHLPTFSFKDENMKSDSIFNTQYFIWSNFEMDKKDVNLEAFQLSAYVFERIGISEGYIMKYHQLKYNDENYLKNLKILEYDILYGKKSVYNGEIPYVATDLKMGIDEIKITDVYDFKDYVCICGENFNDFSTVYINNKEVAAELVSDKLIKVPKSTIRNKDEVAVVQRGSDKIELSRTSYVVGSPKY